jgi:hypothetical protein
LSFSFGHWIVCSSLSYSFWLIFWYLQTFSSNSYSFTNTCAICANHHQSCEFEPCSWRGVLDTTLCDKVRQWFATGWWFSLGIPLSSNKTVLDDITEIFLKGVLKTIKQTKSTTIRLLLFKSKWQLNWTLFLINSFI